MEIKNLIESAWENRELLAQSDVREAILEVIEGLDKGQLRVAEPRGDQWVVNDWIKKGVILYFPITKMSTIEVGPFEYHDKIPLKKGYEAQGVRVVPHAIARYGSFLEPGVIMMPSYVNIGAYVGSGTMVDTWATVEIVCPDRPACTLVRWCGNRRCARTSTGISDYYRG